MITVRENESIRLYIDGQEIERKVVEYMPPYPEVMCWQFEFEDGTALYTTSIVTMYLMKKE